MSEHTSRIPPPQSLKREGEGLRIVWSDGASTHVTWAELRKHCPCAACIEDRAKPPDPFRVLSAREVTAGAPAPLRMTPVGHYAYQISWNDGHDAGIYTLETLKALSH